MSVPKSEIRQLEQEVQELATELNKLKSRKSMLDTRLETIKSSKAFKLWKKITLIREKYIFPVLLKFNITKRIMRKIGYEVDITHFNPLYDLWMKNNTVGLTTLQKQKKESTKLAFQPLISLITPVYNTPEIYLHKMLNAVINQSYENWELCIVDDGSHHEIVKIILKQYSKDARIKVHYSKKNKGIVEASNRAIRMATGQYIGILDHDDELSPDALYEVVSVLNKDRKVEIIYSDDDKMNRNGLRYDPQFKPDWNPELFLSYCYIGHFKVVKKELLDTVGYFRKEFEPSQDYDLFLRLTEKTKNIVHIPKMLYHWRAIPGSTAYNAHEKQDSIEAGRKALEKSIKRRGLNHEVIVPKFAQVRSLGIYKINFTLKNEPKISILIPTKDNVPMLRKCIESINKKTVYKNYEIVIISNNSETTEMMDYLNEVEEKVLYISTKGFNHSQINNKAVKEVDTEYMLFLNDDTEVISGDWLNEMMGVFTLSDNIGAVGGKLIYKDDRVQHAGVIIGVHGTACHANKLLHKDDIGYLAYNQVLRSYSAVTAGCMMTKKTLFEKVKGFDEDLFGISYNDVDYCLKLQELGYRSVYNPYVLLCHYENASRGKTENEEEFENNFKKKWNKYIDFDPFYNINLTRFKENMEISSSSV